MDNIKLYNGDCLEVMAELITQGISVDCIITDLPYETTKLKWDKHIPFEPMWDLINRIIKPNGAVILFGKEPFSSKLRMSNMNNWKYDWIWQKNTKSNFPQAPYQPLNNIEMVHVFSTGYARGFPKEDKNYINIMPYYPQFEDGEAYNIPKESKTTDIFSNNHKNGVYKHKVRDTSKRYPYNTLKFDVDRVKVHSTQKPVSILEYLIKTYTLEGQIVLDFTAGSMSTGVACANTNRKFIGIEKDNDIFNIGKSRIELHLKENGKQW